MIENNGFKMSGWMLMGYGIFYVFVFFALNGYINSNFGPLKTEYYILMYLVLIVNFIALLCGFYILKGNEKIHRVAFPLSIIIILNFPFGTVAGTTYLFERQKNR